MKDLKHLPIEFDAKAVKEDGTFAGYASTFGNVDAGYDVVMPGAFAKSLKDRPASAIKMLWQHDPHQPIGYFTDAKEDDKGLFVKGALLTADVPKARECYALMKAGVIDSMSIGYRTMESEYLQGGVRQLKEVGLYEISMVTFPMNDQATVTRVKNAELNIELLRESLRDRGYSREKRDEVIYLAKQALAMDTEGNRPPRTAEAVAAANEAETAALARLIEAMRA